MAQVFPEYDLSLNHSIMLTFRRQTEAFSVPLPSQWKWAGENLMYRFCIDDPISVCVQLCSQPQISALINNEDSHASRVSSHPREFPPNIVRECSDATPLKFVVRCAKCKQEVFEFRFPEQSEPMHLPCHLLFNVDLYALVEEKYCNAGCKHKYMSQDVVFPSLLHDHAGDAEHYLRKKLDFELTIVPYALRNVDSLKAAALNSLGTLRDEGLLADFTIRVGPDGHELRAHRCVLAAISPVFRRMVDESMGFEESRTGNVDIPDVRVEVMEAALRHMYGQSLGDLDTTTLMELLALAERYELLVLKDHCERCLIQDTTVDPVQLLALADTHGAATLLEIVLERIVKDPNRKHILEKCAEEEFCSAHLSVVQKLLKRL